LGSLNIQRGRDHGIPSYNEIRKFLGLSPVSSMADRPEEISPENWDALAQVYKNPDEVDVYPAGLSETPIPGNRLKILNASKIRGSFHHNTSQLINGPNELKL
jgi:peroxidase